MLEKDVVLFALINLKLDLLTFIQLMYELKCEIVHLYIKVYLHLHLDSFKLVMETMMSMRLKELLNAGKLPIV